MAILSTASLLAIASFAGSGEPAEPTFSLTEKPLPEYARNSTAEALPSLLGLAPTALSPLTEGIDLIHPRTMFSVTFSSGKQNLQFNTTDTTNVPPNPEEDGTAGFIGARVEHFFPNQIGVFFSADFGTVNNMKSTIDFGGGPQQFEDDLDTTLIYLALAYRATVDDDFRMPVRVGPYYHLASLSDTNLTTPGPTAEIDYSTIGIKLVAEPEYIILQKTNAGKMSELTAFLEIGVGSGPSKVKLKGGPEEKGNSFSFGAELGLRYKFFWGGFIALSVIDRKQYYGATDTYNSGGVFNGTEDDYIAGALTLGARL